MPPFSFPPTFSLSTAQTAIEAAAIVAFALSGVIAAVRKRLDAVGVCVVGGLAAFGGGTLRDLLLDRRPFFWVDHVNWLWAMIALAFFAIRYLSPHRLELTEKAIQLPDALGLGLFAASGTQIALDAGSPAMVSVVMGTITAVAGGVLRDIVCNEIPSSFTDHKPYAVCAFAGGWLVVLGHWLNMDDWITLLAGAALAMMLRLLAMWNGWTLPSRNR